MKLTIKTQQFIEKCSLQELQYFASIADKKEFPLLIEFAQRIIDNEKDLIFGLSEADPQKLATEKAFSRGQVAGVTNLIHIFKGAGDELEKRLKNEKE